MPLSLTRCKAVGDNGGAKKLNIMDNKGKTTEEIAHDINSDEHPIIKRVFSLPSSKQEAEEVAAKLIEEVQNGEADPLKTSIKAKFLIDALTEMREAIKRIVNRLVGS